MLFGVAVVQLLHALFLFVLAVLKLKLLLTVPATRSQTLLVPAIGSLCTTLTLRWGG